MESSDLCVSLSLSLSLPSFHAVAPRQLIIDSESVGLLVDQSKALFPQRPSVPPSLRPSIGPSRPHSSEAARAIVFPTSASAAPRLSLPPSLPPIYLRGHLFIFCRYWAKAEFSEV